MLNSFINFGTTNAANLGNLIPAIHASIRSFVISPLQSVGLGYTTDWFWPLMPSNASPSLNVTVVIFCVFR